MSVLQPWSRAEPPARGDSVTAHADDFQKVSGSGYSWLVLCSGFIVAFAVSASLLIGGYFAFRNPGVTVQPPVTAGRNELFPNAFSIKRDGSALVVEHKPALNPSANDFILFVWFNLDKEIKVDQRAEFLRKYEVQDGVESTGYGVAFVGGADGVRPNVYWRVKRGKPRWYPFASTRIERGEWYLLAITLRSRRYLGAHIAHVGSDANVELLGGYDLGTEFLPEGSAPLIVGAIGGGGFEGRVGAFGVLRNVDIASDSHKLIKQLARSPSSGPEALEPSQVVLWADPLKDVGPSGLRVEMRKP